MIIVNYRSAALTLKCIRSVEKERASFPDLSVVVVENDSGDAETLERGIQAEGWSKRHTPDSGWVELITAPKNGGFAYGNNLGFARGFEGERPDYFLLLNPDTEVRSGAIAALLDFAGAHPKAGIIGSSYENEDGSDWKIAFRFPSVWSELERGFNIGVVSRLLSRFVVAQQMGDQPQKTDWVAGACMLIRAELIEQVGGMDQTYFLYYEETDFCIAAQRAGWDCWYVPQSRVMHIAGQSTGVTVRGAKPKRLPAYWFESRRRYFVKNHGVTYASLADLMYLAAYGVGRSKRMLKGTRDFDPPKYLRDFVRHSALRPKNRSLAAAAIFHPGDKR